jgi:hypothetical protein
MSDWITWELCPRCSQRAAVGWRELPDASAPVVHVAVEFDCRHGCRLEPAELAATCPTRIAAAQAVAPW